MFNFINSVKFNAKNAADKAAIKGYRAGFKACDAVACAAVAGMHACIEGQERHQEALDARHAAWMALQDDLRKEEQDCYATDADGNHIEVTVE